MSYYHVLFHPHDAIKSVKSAKSIHEVLLMLVLSALLFGIALFLVFQNLLLAAISAVLIFLLVLFWALLLDVAFFVLMGKNAFYGTLASLTFGLFIWTSGTILNVLIGLLFVFGPLFNTIASGVSGIVMAFTLTFALVITVKALMQFHKIDLLTSLFALCVTHIAIIMGLYVVIFQNFLPILAEISQIPLAQPPSAEILFD